MEIESFQLFNLRPIRSVKLNIAKLSSINVLNCLTEVSIATKEFCSILKAHVSLMKTNGSRDCAYVSVELLFQEALELSFTH